MEATGDEEFYLSRGTPLIIETAMYWLTRLTWDPTRKQYVMLDLMGPDEIHGGIDNNAYTNHLARWHLLKAEQAVADLKAAGRWEPLRKQLKLSDAKVAKWREVAEAIYMPHTRKGFHEQFDGYFRLRERKPDRSLTQAQYTGPVQHSAPSLPPSGA